MIVVTILPLSEYPMLCMVRENYEVPELVAVSPDKALLVPLKLISPVANSKVVIVTPVTEFPLLNYHLDRELPEDVMVPPAMVLLSLASDS